MTKNVNYINNYVMYNVKTVLALKGAIKKVGNYSVQDKTYAVLSVRI